MARKAPGGTAGEGSGACVLVKAETDDLLRLEHEGDGGPCAGAHIGELESFVETKTLSNERNQPTLIRAANVARLCMGQLDVLTDEKQ